jgi:hypothetical protein
VSFVGETWRYRYPITSFVQQAMVKKTMADGSAALTGEERTLLVASTFWNATASGDLHSWFRSDPEDRIRDAIHALSELGAIRMAGIVRAHAGRIVRTRCEAQFNALEELLLRSEDQIEELTARYAAMINVNDGDNARPAHARPLRD